MKTPCMEWDNMREEGDARKFSCCVTRNSTMPCQSKGLVPGISWALGAWVVDVTVPTSLRPLHWIQAHAHKVVLSSMVVERIMATKSVATCFTVQRNSVGMKSSMFL